MIESGTVLDVDELGMRVEVRRTGEETGGELFEFDVVGRARGFITQAHVHARQTERHEVIEGSLRLVLDGKDHVLRVGESMEVPRGASHRQLPADDGPSRVRIQMRPAGNTDAFMARLAEMSAQGQLNRWGYPKPLAGAALVRDFGDEGHAAKPSIAVQRALAGTILYLASSEYLFVDQWDVAAPPEAVFNALADPRTYPQWWRPVYIDVQADGEPGVGAVSQHRFKGRLPYQLNVRSRISHYEPPRVVSTEVDGDLRGQGTWTLTPTADGTHVRFDWRVFADRPLLRVLTPIARPAFRANHRWAIARAMEGLEPYAQRTARVAA
jgi:uncharacterized protein YndB with AHSA1/START domain/quercetin dioxygenase-like cupin family protein